MKFNPVGGPSSARNNIQNEAASLLTCQWSVPVARPGAEVRINVHADRDIEVTTAIINIYQLIDNRAHPVAAFKVPFTQKRDVNFVWSAAGANGSDHEKGELYFGVSVGNYRGTSGQLLLRGKAVIKQQPTVDKWEGTAPKKKLMSLDGN